ncbi:MAG: metallophosphoesterase [Terriglobia bacterium]
MLPWWLASLIFLSVLGLLVGSQFFWFWRARGFLRSRRAAWQRWLFGVPLYAWFLGLAAIFLLAPLRWFAGSDVPVLLSLFMQVRRPVVMVPLGLWVSASMFAFVLIALVQGIGWVARGLRRLVPAARASDALDPERRYFLQTATYAAGALPFIAVGYGFLIGRQNYTVEEVAVPIRNLPSALDGLRIVQLTDVHASAYMPVSEIRRVVGMAQELEPDLVFHTGDFLTSRGDPLEPAIDELSRLEGRYARFGCLGNHEIYARAEDAATEFCARRGVRLLRGESVELEIRGARLNLIGVDYQRQPRGLDRRQWASHFLGGVERLVRPDAVNLLLSHNPNAFLRAAELGIELTLAGHTHGGQVQVEILDSRWAVPRFITPFISGLFERPVPPSPKPEARSAKHALLYVSRGIGTIAAPIRLNAPPEITLLTLRRAV